MAIEDISWDDVALFLKVHEEGSLVKAAHALGITQPTVTRRLQQLEHQLGISLVDRTRTGVTLTAAGLELIGPAAQMRRSASRFVESAVSMDRTLEGPVGVAAPDGLTAFYLMPRIPGFLEQYPDIEVSLDCGLWQMENDRLVSDIAFMATEPNDHDLIRVPVCWLHYSLFASKDYFSAFGRPQKMRDLVGHRSVFHAGAYTQKDNWSDEAAALVTLSRHSLITNSSAASFNAARAGVGITALPTIVMDIAPELEPLPLGRVGAVRMYLCYSRIVSKVPRVRAVLDWINAVFDPKETIWLQEDFVDPYPVWRERVGKSPAKDLRLVK